MKNKKEKILVLTSTFPRWVGDTNPPFVFELSRRLTGKFDITILAPHFSHSKNTEIMYKLKVHRFHYFFEKFEKLACYDGILPTLKANKWYYITVPFFFLFEIIAVLKLVKKLKPDIIHAHWIIPQGFVVYVNYLINKTPYIVTSHGSDLHSLGLNFIKKIILTKAKKITVVSSYLREEIKRIDPNLLSKTEIIPMGVDIKQFNPNKYDESIKEKYRIIGPFLLFVGRLEESKGVKYLIQAMPAIIRKCSKTKLLIIGSGSLEMKLKELTDKLNMNSQIIFLGAVANSELPRYYATADIFVGPSIAEGLGIAFLEAAFSNCIPIGTKIGGISDIIKNNKTGFLVEEKDPKSISKTVIKLLENKKMLQIIMNNLRATLVSKYSWQTVVQKYFDLFGKYDEDCLPKRLCG